MTHSFDIGDPVKIALDNDMLVRCANFGVVQRIRTYLTPEGGFLVRLPDGRLIERHAAQLSPFSATPRFAVGEQVTVSPLFDKNEPSHLRIPAQFWEDVNPVRIMMIRHTDRGFTYLFEDIPIEYSRWIDEIHLLYSQIGDSVDVVNSLRSVIDPDLLAQIRSRLALSNNQQEQALAFALG